jgi:phospholipid/cholesterol/gamma-HCH transport system substrate-binding protein
MRPFTQRNPITLAVVGATVLAVMLVIALNVDRLPLVGSGPTYSAAFAEAAGLQTGEEVRIAGIEVGQVSDITLAGNHVVVTFHVKDATFGTATRASIQIKTLLGQHYLELDPAGPGELPPGAQIPLSRTSVPLNVTPAFQQLTTTIDQINTQQVAQAFDTLASALDDTAPQMRGTLDGLAALSHTIASRNTQIQQLFTRARSVTGVVSAQDAQISQLIGDSDQVLALLDERRDTIHQILVGATDLSGQLLGLVHDDSAQLTPALTELHEVIAVLQADDTQLGQILTNLPPYFRDFTNVVGTGNWFDTTIKIPRGLAVCDNPAGDSLAGLLDPILSLSNKAINGSSTPCLPLGTATDAINPVQPPGGTR